MSRQSRSITLACTFMLVSTALSVPATAHTATPPRTPVPSLTGPLQSTGDSHPFNVSTVSLDAYGYVEEEFLVSGRANVYDYDAAGKVTVVRTAVPYTNRIIVRRPADRRAFSGTVVADIMNMTNGWDLDRMWLTSHDEYLRRGDAYVGITSAPNAVASLKKFDPSRYGSLSWPDQRGCTGRALNSAADSEGGLVWDILSQTGAALKSHGRDNPLRGLKVDKVYATGYSQSGAYLTRYINAVHPLARVYDGFLVAASASGVKPLNKCGPTPADHDLIRPTAEPVIKMQTQTDFFMDRGASRRDDSDQPDDKYRLYEVPGSAHAYAYTSGFAPSPEDLARIGATYNYFKCDGIGTTFPMHYLYNAAHMNLDRWARNRATPPRAPRIQVDAGGQTVLDEHGNAVGGVRTPWVDAPTATYHPASTGPNCFLFGHMTPFTPSKLQQLYTDHGVYARAVAGQVYKLVKEGWLTREDGAASVNEAAGASVPR
ncbi:alpha/beta hydrolase domain-containing protein [Nonomuraea turcica]|uniref:alpha/beta hydrolase domain-containing protein n=1 Tax=Nonomuraea sp. G32 TaxID=3067274 RepID=UPI00273CB6C5|nr:alpha/beta hydrolase domain-containing protein [Nonomuraea sp. G32]MDP4501964.1 alpha/beta hydrolase domain-containing protein [Nonomuraea sp. G32]